MKLQKRTFVLPTETLSRFEATVAPGRRSAKIAELIEAWIKAHEREALRRDIAEGCRDMWDVYTETAREWEPLEADLDRTLDT
jgi:hypothetical protein